MVRSKATPIEAMDKASKIEKVSLYMMVPHEKGDKERKWEDSSRPYKNKKGHHDKKGDKSSFCMRSHYSHKRSCNKNILSCRSCGNLGHKHLECKSVEPLYFNCHQTGHMSRQGPNQKVYPSGSGKKTSP